jgi:hypothetical protein
MKACPDESLQARAAQIPVRLQREPDDRYGGRTWSVWGGDLRLGQVIGIRPRTHADPRRDRIVVWDGYDQQGRLRVRCATRATAVCCVVASWLEEADVA